MSDAILHPLLPNNNPCKNELFAACSTAKDWKQLMKIITPLEEGLRQRLFEVIYSSEENEDL